MKSVHRVYVFFFVFNFVKNKTNKQTKIVSHTFYKKKLIKINIFNFNYIKKRKQKNICIYVFMCSLCIVNYITIIFINFYNNKFNKKYPLNTQCIYV